MDLGQENLEIYYKNFFETQIKDMTVLNERVGLTSSANNVNLDEMDTLVDA